MVNTALPAIVFRLKGNSIRTAGGAFHHAVRPTSRNQVLTAVIEILEILNRFKESGRAHTSDYVRIRWSCQAYFNSEKGEGGVTVNWPIPEKQGFASFSGSTQRRPK